MTQTLSRYKGSLLGLAAADAVGTSLEFKPPGSFSPIDDMIGGGPFRLNPGEWTDDTSMALCLAASLVETGRFDLKDQIERYQRWYRDGYMSSNGRCFDIGNTVSSALRRYELDGNPAAGSTSVYSAGNGSIMRLSPVPMFFGMDADKAVAFSARSSVSTHGAPTAVDACRYFGGLIFAALNGIDKETLLQPYYTPLSAGWQPGMMAPEIEEIAAGSFKHRQPPEIKGSGYVVKSLEAALWAFNASSSFREGCLLAANLGDDADTTAAVYGQLAGAYYGVEGIPTEWLHKLARRDEIERLAAQLYHHRQADGSI